MNDQASQAPAPQPPPVPMQPQPGKTRKVAFGCGGCLILVIALLFAGGFHINHDFPAMYRASKEVEKYVVSPESLKVNPDDCKIVARIEVDRCRIVYVPFSSKNRFGVVLPGHMLALAVKLDDEVSIMDCQLFEKPPTMADLNQLIKKTGVTGWEIEPWLK